MLQGRLVPDREEPLLVLLLPLRQNRDVPQMTELDTMLLFRDMACQPKTIYNTQDRSLYDQSDPEGNREPYTSSSSKSSSSSMSSSLISSI
jgi:hypothetical protein